MNRNISFSKLSIYIIILLMFLGSTNSTITYISLIFSFLLALVIGSKNFKNTSIEVCIGIVYLLVFQNLCIGLGAHIFGNNNSNLKLITQIPFLVIATIWICIEVKLLKSKKNNLDKSKKYFVIYVLLVLFSLVVGRGSFQSILINIRNMTVFFMAFSIGKYCIDTNEKLVKFSKEFIKITILVFILGVILLVFGYDLYEKIGLVEVYLAKGVTLIEGKLDGRFRTTLVTREYSRMGSIYYEPVNLAYFFAMAFLVSHFAPWTNNKFKKNIVNIITTIGLVLTFGKGGYLIVITILICIFSYKFMKTILKNISQKTSYKFIILIVSIGVTIFCIYYYRNIGAAASPHFWGIIRTWKSIQNRPYGYGLGTGGNMAQVFNSSPTSWFDSGGETALMSFMYQIGIQGVLFLFLCFKEISILNNKDNTLFMKVFVFLPFVLLGISLLQDNTFTPQCIVLPMLFQGAVKSIVEKEGNYV